MAEALFPARAAVLADMRTRLRGAAIPGVGDNVFSDRAALLPQDRLPAIVLYAPAWAAVPRGGSWEWPAGLTVVLEIQADCGGESWSNGTWASVAERIGASALEALFSDAQWRRFWTRPPRIEGAQFLRGGPNADTLLVGETITLHLEPRAPLVFPLAPLPLEGVDAHLALDRAAGVSPSASDVSLSLEVPPCFKPG